jgi:hypothetical protein
LPCRLIGRVKAFDFGSQPALSVQVNHTFTLKNRLLGHSHGQNVRVG